MAFVDILHPHRPHPVERIYSITAFFKKGEVEEIAALAQELGVTIHNVFEHYISALYTIGSHIAEGDVVTVIPHEDDDLNESCIFDEELFTPKSKSIMTDKSEDFYPAGLTVSHQTYQNLQELGAKFGVSAEVVVSRGIPAIHRTVKILRNQGEFLIDNPQTGLQMMDAPSLLKSA